MKSVFGICPDGQPAYLYTIAGDGLTAQICDLGATLHSLLVPDRDGNVADVVLGYAAAKDYCSRATYLGATIGRNANRIRNAVFSLNGRRCKLPPNDHARNSLHSGPDSFHCRIWQVIRHEENSITLGLNSPSGDQGFPGNAAIRVTYTLEHPKTLAITYDALCDEDTVFNMTNHSYFNLAGHEHPEKAMQQVLSMPARFFTPADAESIPTGEIRDVTGTPMDFRDPKPIGQDIDADYDALQLQGGYDHNFEVFTNPCAILSDADSGRVLAVSTDCPGLQLYTGNYLVDEPGKDGMLYPRRSGICLETQFYPDSVNRPQWRQPITKAHTPYRSRTKYKFSCK